VVHVVLGPEIVGPDELIVESVSVPGCLEDLDGLGDYLPGDAVPDQGQYTVFSRRLLDPLLLPDEFLDALPLEDLPHV
jgi:hypothetical protein